MNKIQSQISWREQKIQKNIRDIHEQLIYDNRAQTLTEERKVSLINHGGERGGQRQKIKQDPSCHCRQKSTNNGSKTSILGQKPQNILKKLSSEHSMISVLEMSLKTWVKQQKEIINHWKRLYKTEKLLYSKSSVRDG